MCHVTRCLHVYSYLIQHERLQRAYDNNNRHRCGTTVQIATCSKLVEHKWQTTVAEGLSSVETKTSFPFINSFPASSSSGFAVGYPSVVNVSLIAVSISPLPLQFAIRTRARVWYRDYIWACLHMLTLNIPSEILSLVVSIHCDVCMSTLLHWSIPYFRDQTPHSISGRPRIIAALPEGLNEINAALV